MKVRPSSPDELIVGASYSTFRLISAHEYLLDVYFKYHNDKD